MYVKLRYRHKNHYSKVEISLHTYRLSLLVQSIVHPPRQRSKAPYCVLARWVSLLIWYPYTTEIFTKEYTDLFNDFLNPSLKMK